MSSCRYVYLTYIDKTYMCDSYFIGLNGCYKLIECSEIYTHDSINFQFMKFIRSDSYPEKDYFQIIYDILNAGNIRNTRNGKVLSVFGKSIEFDVSESFPMMTSRHVFLRGIFEELMWIVRGQTDTKILDDKGVKIWNANSSREFLDSVGLHNFQTGDVGATYGFVMRHFGADYINCNTDYTGKGYDQLYEIIDKIKNYPNDRRLIISLWNPCYLNKCSLPPCVRDYQFYVDDKKLSLQVNIRSSDVPVALHWNICSAGLFLYLMAAYCDLKPASLKIIIGDAHIYLAHCEQANEIIKLGTKPFPKLSVINIPNKFEDFEYKDIKTIGYFPNPLSKNMIA